MKNEPYPGIDTLNDLYDALCEVWCRETCTPRLREKWSEDNRTCGQCSVTAFLVQDIFGGTVYGLATESGIHCFNRTGGGIIDLTAAQFRRPLLYVCDEEQTREKHFQREEKRLRYELLKARLSEYCRDHKG